MRKFYAMDPINELREKVESKQKYIHVFLSMKDFQVPKYLDKGDLRLQIDGIEDLLNYCFKMGYKVMHYETSSLGVDNYFHITLERIPKIFRFFTSP